MFSSKFRTFLLCQFPTCKLTSKGKYCNGGQKRIKHVCKVWRNNLQALLRNSIFDGGIFFSRTLYTFFPISVCLCPCAMFPIRVNERMNFEITPSSQNFKMGSCDHCAHLTHSLFCTYTVSQKSSHL